MKREQLMKYIGHKVLIILDNNFKYKIFLEEKNIIGETLSFTGKFGEPIDLQIERISLITISEDDYKEERK